MPTNKQIEEQTSELDLIAHDNGHLYVRVGALTYTGEQRWPTNEEIGRKLNSLIDPEEANNG